MGFGFFFGWDIFFFRPSEGRGGTRVLKEVWVFFGLAKGVLDEGTLKTVLTVDGFLFLQQHETWKDEKEVQAAKDMVVMARQHLTNEPASTPDGGS